MSYDKTIRRTYFPITLLLKFELRSIISQDKMDNRLLSWIRRTNKRNESRLSRKERKQSKDSSERFWVSSTAFQVPINRRRTNYNQFIIRCIPSHDHITHLMDILMENMTLTMDILLKGNSLTKILFTTTGLLRLSRKWWTATLTSWGTKACAA